MLSNFFYFLFFIEFTDKFLSLIYIELNYFFKIILLINITLFSVGLFSITLENKNFLLIFLSIELLNASLIMFFIVISCFYLNMGGIIYSLLLLSVAATESAIGLSLLINYHFAGKDNYLYLYNLNFLKG